MRYPDHILKDHKNGKLRILIAGANARIRLYLCSNTGSYFSNRYDKSFDKLIGNMPLNNKNKKSTDTKSIDKKITESKFDELCRLYPNNSQLLNLKKIKPHKL